MIKSIMRGVDKILLLIVVMVVTTVCLHSQTTAWSGKIADKFSGGNGDAVSPYIIGSGEELAFLAKNVNDGNPYGNKYFVLANDIDLGEREWTPIGTSKDDRQFKGKFNGNNHLIVNLSINEPDTTGVGLFGYFGSGGEIHNLGIGGTSNIVGGGNVGAIVGINGGNIRNCYSIANVTANQSDKKVGGIVGLNNGTVKACYNAGRVSGNITGGICGWDLTTGNITECFFDIQMSTIISTYPRAVGNKNNIKDQLEGKTTVDMTSGKPWSLEFTKSDWYFYFGIYPQFAAGKDVSMSKVSVSPIFMSNSEGVNSVKSSFTVSTVNGCSWKAESTLNSIVIEGDKAIVKRPTASNDNVSLICTQGGVSKKVCVIVQKTICNIHITIIVEEDSSGKVTNGGKKKNNDDFITFDEGSTTSFVIMPDPGNYLYELKWEKRVGGDVRPVAVEGGDVRPVAVEGGDSLLYATPAIYTDMNLTVTFSKCKAWSGKVTQPFASPAGNYILIYTAEDLAYIAKTAAESGDFTGVKIKLLNDISLNEDNYTDGNGKSWIPIGMPNDKNSKAQFNGVFEGNWKKIRNIYIDLASKSYVGLFSVIGSNGYVADVTIESGKISGRGWVGAIAGENRGSIIYCNNASVVTSTYQKTGGIVGFNNVGIIENCKNWEKVTGTVEVGGVIGYNYDADVKNCENYGDVTYPEGSYSKLLGGVIGRNNSKGRIIENCYNSGIINGMDYCGGIVGKNIGDAINFCTNLGDVGGSVSVGGIAGELLAGELKNSYNRGAIVGTTGAIGGLVGDNYTGKITRSFNKGIVKGGSSVGGVAGINEGSITNCYNTNEVIGTDFIGGLAGKCLNGSSISKSYSNSCVSGEGANKGAITGGIDTQVFPLSDCRYDNDTCTIVKAYPNEDTEQAKGISTYELKKEAFTASPWRPDFPDWGTSVNDGYPILDWQGSRTGITNVVKAEYKVYPNPVKNIINIDGDEILRVSIFDMSGRLINSYGHFDYNASINLSNLKNGIYMLNITNKSGASCIKKIIKQ